MTDRSERAGVLRPAQLGLLLLASGESLPRQRARDQRADVAGSRLKRRVLGRLVEIDPDPDELLEALERIVAEIGEPTGPTRAIVLAIAGEMAAIRDNPQLTAWLLEEAVRFTQAK